MNWMKLIVGKKEPWVLQFGGFISGFLLTLPGIFSVLAPVQAIALVPAIMALRRMERWRQCDIFGFRMGLAYIAPQTVVLRLPPAVSLILVAYFLLWFIVFTTISRRLLAAKDVWGCLAFGAFLAVLDWAGFTVMPMWGTAQSLSRCWSSYPQIIAFTSVTGITGIAFALGAVQALGVTIASHRRWQIACVLVLIVMVVSVTIVDVLVACERTIGHIKVGAVGWLLPEAEENTRDLYAKLIVDAASQGVQLVVSPETAFGVYDDNDPEGLVQFRDLCHRHGVYLSVGYFDAKSSQNRSAFISPSNGISAIISPKGRVLAIKDHFTDGPGLIVADVPIYEQWTIFSRCGHWFVAICGAFLGGSVLHTLSGRRSNKESVKAVVQDGAGVYDT